VEPDRVRAPTELMLERVLDLMERRNGVRPDMDSGATHTNVCFPTLYYFLFEDPVFEDWLLHPVVRALVDYLLGEQCVLHATTVFMKGPTDPPDRGLQLRLHSDQQMVPDPFPPYALIAGATLLLTDYTKENGAFAFVPGSHRACRHPVVGEAEDRAVPVEAPAGSLLVHHGALWHGSFGRTEPGIRAGLAYAYSRMFVTPLEGHRERVTKDILDRYPPRFAQLLGLDVPTGTAEQGPDLQKVARSIARTPWD
jgi:ectoine hydroxylase-related dioxygenase (phytanoyl-CoA dioxygenase family)